MRVIIAEDSVILREGLARLLGEAGLTVTGLAGDAEDLLPLVAAQRPHAVVVDIRMPPTHTDEGLRAAREIRERHPGTGVLVLSQYIETGPALDALARNPKGFGYLLKDRVADIGRLTDALGRVARGESVMDPLVVERLFRRRRVGGGLDDLTGREREVLALMAEGRSNEAITQSLGVGAKTVETHVRNVFTKLRLEPSQTDHRRVLAVLAYLRQ
ncbi:response regulator transcription factor [Streptomyces sp. F63]|uniref:response regulator transcription factor n=1 Tax=Streptomyces sp. F63 TaxID=2824887 RepID=UPI001B3872D4|nr:response regulator transcription factor [Streptomyces sp. F63]MBQ0985805.1 response regulator transcription factor [Streptomyces sp. F63]